ncbi:unnamed protein product, partial [Brachionus calyciflorus]
MGELIQSIENLSLDGQPFENKNYKHKHISEYIENCLKCQEWNTSGQMSRAPLQPIITIKVLQLFTCDILGPLNTTERENMEACKIDFYKWCFLSVKNFESNFFKRYLELIDFHKKRTTPYHQLCDGSTERFNIIVISIMHTFENKNQDDWDQLFYKFAFAYRTAVHRATGYTPFEMVYERRL